MPKLPECQYYCDTRCNADGIISRHVDLTDEEMSILEVCNQFRSNNAGVSRIRNGGDGHHSWRVEGSDEYLDKLIEDLS